MSGRVELSEEAERDLEDIWWYAYEFAESVDRADRVLDDINRTLEMLAAAPALGGTRSWLARGQRAFVSRGYVVVYSPIPDGIGVARISSAHSALRVSDGDEP